MLYSSISSSAFLCYVSSPAKSAFLYSTLRLELPQSLFQIKSGRATQLSVLMAWLSPFAEPLCYCSRDGGRNFYSCSATRYKQDSRLGGRRGWGIAGLLGLSLTEWNLCPTGKLVWRLLKPSILSLLCLG